MTTADADRLDRLRLARTEGVGPITFRRLMSRFASAAEALDALPGLAVAGGRTSPPRIPHAADIRREMAATAKRGATLLLLGDPLYPQALAATDDAPPVLLVLGDPAVLSRRTVALVGARNASANGRRMAELLAADLAGRGIVVVSGLARGIDAAAHTGALHAGHTVAAIAGGLDVPYPPENTDLQRQVAEGGAVVTEAPWGTAPQSRHFPKRNRIIAGLSLGIVVVEAALRSGSLITARMAQDAHREIFAVPGSPLDPRCHGSNDLIRQGGHLTETAADVLQHLPQGWVDPAPGGFNEPAPPPLAPPHDPRLVCTRVLQLLGPSPSAVDDLVRRCQFSASAVMAALLELELSGRVEMLPGHRVSLLEDHSPVRHPAL